MLLGFDHVVLGVTDLRRAEADLQSLGFRVTKRPDEGTSETENRLICFEDGSYIEVFALKDSSRPSTHRWAQRLATGEGWLDYSLHVADLAPVAQRLQAAGLPTIGPRTGSRALTDGRRWGVAVQLAGLGAGDPALPFFIQDTEERAVRVPDGPARKQPAGVSGIVGVTVLTADLAAVEPGFTAIFGTGSPVARPDATKVMCYTFAGQWVELVQPDSGSETASDLRQRGEGLFEVALGRPGEPGPGNGALLPRERTHGARLRCPI